MTSDKDVVTIDWEGGSYTGEVSDGVPQGKGTHTENILYYDVTINMTYQYSHEPDLTPQDAWEQGSVKQQRVRQISDNEWQVVYENTFPASAPSEEEAKKWLLRMLDDIFSVEEIFTDGTYQVVHFGVNFDPEWDDYHIEIVDVETKNHE